MSEEKIVDRGITHEMRSAYIDYSMSVIVSRALPDVRDGLKPVHRRVLYGMSELGLASNRPTKKSARIVGEVLGKYHPHGDGSVYDTMVRMAQEWSLRYPLVDGQGNFGSIDGDSPAAMRYTEARLKAIAEAMLADIDKNTVDFGPNFDDSLQEPLVLPSGIPNLLVNGASGIAVGMATNMAPHNLREVVAGVIAYIDNREITVAELMAHIPAPDFPTGGTIYGITGVKEAFETGRGRVVVRARANIEVMAKDREAIIVDEIPYQVNKAVLVEKIAELRDEKRIEGIGEIRDESNREGIRVVIELKRDAAASVVLNQLYKYTQLQVSFGVNNVALVKGRPQTLNLKELIHHYVEHRHEVVVRRTQYELDEALQRAHILEGLLVALDNLDAIIALIRAADSPETARTQLIERFGLSEIQAKAILDMRLQRLTGLERDKIRAEYAEIQQKIDYYRRVLADQGLRMELIKDELQEVARRFGDERRTHIEPIGEEINLEDLIADEPVAITVSHQGYIKRTLLTEYRVQKRGGTGSRGVGTKEEDWVEHLYIASTHNYLLFFTEKGRCYWLRVFEIPEGSRTTKGRAIQNLIQIEPNDKVLAMVNVPNLKDASSIAPFSILMCTEQGTVKKTELEAYSRPRVGGIIAITVAEGDRLLAAELVTETSEVVIATTYGMACRFGATDVRDMGRGATGVRGIRLSGKPDDKVVGMVAISNEKEQLLVVSENGYGKRSEVLEYRKTNRGAQGVKTLNITDKTGKLMAINRVTEAEGLMIVTQAGITIRMNVADTPLLGRNAQGSRLIRLRDDDAIASVALLPETVTDDETAPEEVPVQPPAE